MKAGMKVSLYRDPLMGNGYEGEGILIRRTSTPISCDALSFRTKPCEHTEHWIVELENGSEVVRSIYCGETCQPRYRYLGPDNVNGCF